MSAVQAPISIVGSTMADHVTPLVESFDRLRTAAVNAGELLALAGLAGMRGDTADDLRVALAIHSHLVNQFNATVSTGAGTTTYRTCAGDAAGAQKHQGDAPCGITMTPIELGHQLLVDARHALRVSSPLNAALNDPALGRALRS